MSEAKRDGNKVTVAMGVSSVDGITPVPLRVDPVTGYLLIEVIPDTDIISFPVSSPAKRDGNRVPASLGIDSNSVLYSLVVAPSSALLVDIA